MGNTTSMKASHMKGPHMKGPHAHQHGDMTCTMKHGRRRRHHRTAKHKRSGHKRSGSKRLYSGSSLMVPISPKKKNHRNYSGGVLVTPGGK